MPEEGTRETALCSAGGLVYSPGLPARTGVIGILEPYGEEGGESYLKISQESHFSSTVRWHGNDY